MRASLIALFVVVVASVSFFLGRSAAPEGVTTSVIQGGPVVVPAHTAETVTGNANTASSSTGPVGAAGHRERRDEAPTPPSAPLPVTPTGATGAGAPAPAATCEVRLEQAQAELATLVKRHEELEGKPIPARDDVAPRFASAGLLSTFQRGFVQSGVKGQVESVDCSEHPCILFGRLEGDEGEVAKLEDSAVFAAYDDDIGVMLTWASGHGGHDDEGHQGDKPGAGREKPDEVSLFAFAFYGVDEEGRSEQIDRRIRTRTAEYWNASRPRE